MMAFRKLLFAVRSLPERLGHAEESLARITGMLTDVKLFLSHQKPEPTFVYVLPPSGGSDAMMARRMVIGGPGVATIAFEPQVPIPAGSWIVAVGPALVRGVRVGNRSQEAFAGYDGQVCQTRDPVEPDMRLTVLLALPDT